MRQEGFSLLEVMVALAILATALVVVFSHQAVSIDVGNEAKIMTKATLLVQDRMAALIAQEEVRVGVDEGEAEEGNPVFKWKTEVEESETEGMKRVTVVIAWKEGGREKDLRVVTYVSAEE